MSRETVLSVTGPNRIARTIPHSEKRTSRDLAFRRRCYAFSVAPLTNSDIRRGIVFHNTILYHAIIPVGGKGYAVSVL
jgi:hypothetical protein